jgi:hypothetical protein
MKKKPSTQDPTELAISTKVISLKGEIEACHREMLKSGNEMLKNAVRVGELLTEVQAVLKASKSSTFENYIEQFLPFSRSAAFSYLKLYKGLEKIGKSTRRGLLESADSIAEARKLISEATPAPKSTPKPPPVTVDAESVQPADDKPNQTEGYINVIRGADQEIEAATDPPTPAEILAEAQAADNEPAEPIDPEELASEHNKQIEAYCREIMKLVEACPRLHWIEDKRRWDGFKQKVKQGCDTLRTAKCVVCPACGGEGCDVCSDQGIIPKMMADSVK